MEDYIPINKCELIKSFDKNKSFLIKVYVSTNKQPFYNDYLSDFNYELEGKLYSIDNDIIKINGKKNYFFDDDNYDHDNLTGIFIVDELSSGCYNDCSGETTYHIKFIDSVKRKNEKENNDQITEKKHKMESSNENLIVKTR